MDKALLLVGFEIAYESLERTGTRQPVLAC